MDPFYRALFLFLLFTGCLPPHLAFGEACRPSDKFTAVLENKQGSWHQDYKLKQKIAIPDSDITCVVNSSWNAATLNGTLFPRYAFPSDDHLTLNCASKAGPLFAAHASLAGSTAGSSFLGMSGYRPSEALMIGTPKNVYYLSVKCSKADSTSN